MSCPIWGISMGYFGDIGGLIAVLNTLRSVEQV